MPKESIKLEFWPKLADVINRHVYKFEALHDNPAIPVTVTENDEQEILHVLMGLSRLIEHNVRTGYEKLARETGLKTPNPDRYEPVIQGLEKILPGEPGVALTRKVASIGNALVHSKFGEVYRKTEEAYDLPGIELRQKSFGPVIMITSTITRHGLNIDMETLTATDNRGKPIPAKPYLPGYGDSIGEDFKFFYTSGCFIFTYDVLRCGYEATVLFRYT